MPRIPPKHMAKLDGPRLRACATDLAFIKQAAFAAGMIPAEFVAQSAVRAARDILRNLYLEQPKAFELVLRRVTTELQGEGEPINPVSISQLMDDLEFEDLAAMRDAFLRCGIVIELPATDWKEICNG